MKSPRIWLCRVALATLVAVCVAVLTQAQTPAHNVRVTLLQLNDVYQIAPVDKGKNSGLARIATLRKQILAESPNTLFLLAGDTISPSVASSVFKGAQMIAAWNAAGLDYAALGNHEFDFGDDVLLERMKESKFVWLGANAIDRRTNKPFNDTPPYVIRTFNGVKVGIFGLITVDTATTSKPSEHLRFVDPVLTAKSLVKKMRLEGARVIVAVTHLTMSEDKRLAAAGLVDVILGGHDHEVLFALAGRTPIFKWGSDARLLGRIDLNINATTGKLTSVDWAGLPVTDAIADDPATAAVIADYEAQLSAELDKPVGRTAVELDARALSNRNRETNLGNLITDALRQETNADVAIYSGGSIRSDTTYPPGELSKRDVLSILPFENPVLKVEVSGALLRAALENGVSQAAQEQESGRFPQVSGWQFEFDARRPVGARVTKVTVNNQPLDDKKTYTLASSLYVIEGGDGYTMFKDARRLIDEESAQLDSTVLENLIKAAGEVAPQIEGRIKRLDSPVRN